MSMPSSSTLVWLELVPRMKMRGLAARAAGLDDVQARHFAQHIGQRALLARFDLRAAVIDRDAAGELSCGVGMRVALTTTVCSESGSAACAVSAAAAIASRALVLRGRSNDTATPARARCA